MIRELGLEPVVYADTAAGAKMVSEKLDHSQAAIASELAGKIYGLESLRANIEDAEHNTTRFLLMSQETDFPELDESDWVTSFIFKIRNVPAALYKAMGGFATNGVNMTKLESYMVDGNFYAVQFYAEIEGHLDEKSVQLAMEELNFFSTWVKILGVFQADTFRQLQKD